METIPIHFSRTKHRWIMDPGLRVTKEFQLANLRKRVSVHTHSKVVSASVLCCRRSVRSAVAKTIMRQTLIIGIQACIASCQITHCLHLISVACTQTEVRHLSTRCRNWRYRRTPWNLTTHNPQRNTRNIITTSHMMRDSKICRSLWLVRTNLITISERNFMMTKDQLTQKKMSKTLTK